VGGAASSSAIESQMLAKFDGKIEFDSVTYYQISPAKDGEENVVVITRMGEMRIVNDEGIVLLQVKSLMVLP
jgi:DNA-directed RNA polymerase subunit beta'